jgi:hypothetical protein
VDNEAVRVSAKADYAARAAAELATAIDAPSPPTASLRRKISR